MTPEQKARVADLEASIGSPNHLTTTEYIGALEEIRDNYIKDLLIRSIERETNGLGAVSQALERVGYLLETVKPKAAGDGKIVIAYELDLPAPPVAEA